MAQPSKGKNSKGPKHLDKARGSVVSANDMTGIVQAKKKPSER